jgi:branched-chain amino acid transport system substrate-binding protein
MHLSRGVPGGDRDVSGSGVAPFHRRSLLRSAGLGAIALAAVPVLNACRRVGLRTASSDSDDQTIRIGYVSPRTGPYAAFADCDPFILAQMREVFGKCLISGGVGNQVRIIDRDTGSEPQQTAMIADELISRCNVDLVLVTATPETVHSVAAKCEREGVPCISTNEPRQAFFVGQNATPDKPFTYTYHFFDGIQTIASVESSIWELADTNKIKDRGYAFVDPGAYEDGTKDFSSIIATFKSEEVDILAGVQIPPDFATLSTQAAQQGFTPKVAR